MNKPGMDALVAVVDSREQAPFSMAPMGEVAGTLAAGDYSGAGHVKIIYMEYAGDGP